MVAASANVQDSVVVEDPLHGDETPVWGDSAYSGKTERIAQVVAPRAQDFTNPKGHKHHPLSAQRKCKDRNKYEVRASAEHPFGVTKRRVGFTKVHCCGLIKNTDHLIVSFALVNLATGGEDASQESDGRLAGRFRLTYAKGPDRSLKRADPDPKWRELAFVIVGEPFFQALAGIIGPLFRGSLKNSD